VLCCAVFCETPPWQQPVPLPSLHSNTACICHDETLATEGDCLCLLLLLLLFVLSLRRRPCYPDYHICHPSGNHLVKTEKTRKFSYHPSPLLWTTTTARRRLPWTPPHGAAAQQLVNRHTTKPTKKACSTYGTSPLPEGRLSTLPRHRPRRPPSIVAPSPTPARQPPQPPRHQLSWQNLLPDSQLAGRQPQLQQRSSSPLPPGGFAAFPCKPAISWRLLPDPYCCPTVSCQDRQ
jgi:hypothetical protein